MQPHRPGDFGAEPLRQEIGAQILVPGIDVQPIGSVAGIIDELADIVQQRGHDHRVALAGLCRQVPALHDMVDLACRLAIVIVRVGIDQAQDQGQAGIGHRAIVHGIAAPS